jgi:DNA-binding NtrC family response regulator
LAVNSHTNIIGIQDLPHKFQSITPNFETSKNADISSFLDIPLAEVEKMLIDRTLIETSGNRAKAARMLGISLRTLQRKLKETGRARISPLNAKAEV